MDIPLPGEPDPHLAKYSAGPVTVDISSPHNIPLPSPRGAQLPRHGEVNLSIPPPLPPPATDPEDSNRYSPSRATDDDLVKDDPPDQDHSQSLGSPSVLPTFGTKGVRTTVLGKAQAKKRLLAFSMTKQGGGQGLSFGFNKKAMNKMSTGNMPFAGTSADDDAGDKEKDDKHLSPKKKIMTKKGIPRDDKARAVVSAIEEIKREEMLMRGVLGYGSQLGTLEQPYQIPLVAPALISAVKPREEVEMSNILSERQKGAIEELLGSLLTHDSRKSKDEEKEKRRSDDRRKRDSGKSSRHSKERHRSKERHSRGGREREREREKEVKKHRPSELPKTWQQFRDKGFKFEEIRRLKLKLEKDKLSSNNRERNRRSRDREHRSRSSEKRHKSPSQPEEKERINQSDYDIMSKPFESTSRVIYPFIAVGIRQMQKQYPRSLIRFSKARPAIPYCENPTTSKAFYRTREEILFEASERVVELMQCVINGDLCKSYVKSERNFKTKQTTDTNLSNSLAALQVSYDETEIDENMSSSDDTSGNRRERPWFLPEKMVVWPDREETCIGTSSDAEINIKRERNEESDEENFRKKDGSLDLADVKESDFISSEREREVKVEPNDSNISMKSNERTTVRSKWDSDYEDDKGHDETVIENSCPVPEVCDDAESWDRKDNENEYELTSENEVKSEKQSKSGSESDGSNASTSESSSGNESNAEDSPNSIREENDDKNEDSNYDQNNKFVDKKEIDDDVKGIEKVGNSCERENSPSNAHPESGGDGSTNLKLASEYEEFMKAVSFESSTIDNGQEDVCLTEQDEVPPKELDSSPIFQEERQSRHSDDADSDASHDKLDVDPTFIEEPLLSSAVSESKEHVTPKLMTSSASEDELSPSEDKQLPKEKVLEVVEQNTSHSKRERKHRSSSSESSSSSDSSHDSEELKEKRKSKSKKLSKKKRKKVVRSKKKQKKISRKKHVESSSSSDSDSSSDKESSSSSSSDEVSRKKAKHKERNKRRAKSSSSEESDNDSSSDNLSSDERNVRKKKKKKKAKKVIKKKASKKKKRSRKESDSSDSDENINHRRSKSSRHKSSKKEISKDNDMDQSSEDEKVAANEDSNASSEHRQDDSRPDRSKKQSRRSKNDTTEKESIQKKSSKKYKGDHSSADDSNMDDREKKKGSRKKSNSYKKSSNYHASDSSEDESERKTIKKRRRERRSCTTSPVVSSNKKRRRSPSTSSEHSPTPQRRNSAEGKSFSQRGNSKEKSSTNRKLKHNSSSNKKGHKQKDVEESEQDDSYSEDTSLKGNRDNRDFRSHNLAEENDWDVNSEEENREMNASQIRNPVDTDIFSQKSPRKVFSENFSDKTIKEKIKEETFSDNDLKSCNRNKSSEIVDSAKYVPVSNRRQSLRCLDDNTDDDNSDIDFQRRSRSSSSINAEASNVAVFVDVFSHIQVKTEPKETSSNYSTKDYRKSVCVKLFSPSDLDDDSKTLSSKSQLTGNREICSTDSSQLSQSQEKVSDKYGSDKSGDSLRDIEDTKFGASVLRKQKFINIVEENARGTNREPSSVKCLPTRGTNFVLDNIPLPPLNISRESSSHASQKLDLPDDSRTNKGNNKTLNIISDFSSEISNSPGLSFKTSSQRPIVSFKLLSPSNLLPSSQVLVDTSDVLDENKTSRLDTSKVIGKVPGDISETGKKITAENNQRGTTVFETSKDEWSEECSMRKPTESSDTECATSEVSSSSSKISVEANFEKLTSSVTNIHSKERSRKRPSRWGMTTVPPKKKVVEDLYESLTAARREVELSPNINKFYDDYLSNIEETGKECVKENSDNSADSQKKLSDDTKYVSEKEIDSDIFSHSDKVSSWELPESVEKTDSWEEGQDNHKYKLPDPQNKKKREKHVQKMTKESSGSVIDWEKDLDHSKETKDILTDMEDVTLLLYHPDPEVPNLDDRERLIAAKGHSSQEESGSEWESKEESLNPVRETSFRESDDTVNSKERTRREKQDTQVEKSIHRRINFDESDQWEDQRWLDSVISTDNSETSQNKGEHIESKRENSDSQNLPERSKKKLEEEARIDEAYRDAHNKDNDGEVEKLKVGESVPRDEKEWYKNKERVEEKNETNILGDIEVPSKIPVMYTEGTVFHTLSNEESVRTIEKDENQEGKGDQNVFKREENVQDSSTIENKDKTNKDYQEQGKLIIVEKDRSKSEERARKHGSEKEHRENEEVERQHDERSRKEYTEARSMGRDRDKRESENRESRHEDGHVRKDYGERERSSTRDRERREGRSDRRDERRRERERDRRSNRRERERWERDKRDRNRDEREPRRSRSPTDYHHEHDRRESRCDERQHERDRSQSPPPEYWQGDWAHVKERNCDSAGNYYVQDIPLPINSINASGSGIWPSRGTGETEMELSCSPASSPLVGFKRSLADSTISDSELVSCKQEDMIHRSQEMSPSSAYSQSVVPGKGFDRKPTFIKQQPIESSLTERPPTPEDSPAFSPKRISLDDRIEMELGVKNMPPLTAVPQYQVYQHQQPPPSSHQHPSPQQQQPQFAYSQYYTHVPPPTQFDARSDKYMSVPPPPYGQPEEYGTPQHMYPPPNMKPLLPQMRPPSLEPSASKRRPPLLPTPPNIRPMMNWDSPEAFIGNQPPPSSRVVQVGNVLQVVPLEVPPPVPQGPGSSQQSLVLQSGNVLQVIPSESMSPSVPCSEPLPSSSASSQVVQVGNVLQVIPGPTTPNTSRSMGSTTPSKATFPPSSSHSSPHGIPPHLNVVSLPSMLGPPPSQGAPVHPSPTQGPITHPPPLHGLPNHPPPHHGLLTHPPPTHRSLAQTPPIRVPVQTPPIQVSSVHGIPALPLSPTPLLKSPSLEISPSPVITSPLVSMHGPVPPPAGMVQAVAASSPVLAPESVLVSAISPVSPGVLPTIVPTPVAAPISYSPPASPFLVPPAAQPPVLSGGVPEGIPVMQPQGGDCPIPFLSSVEMAQASQMEDVERRRAEKLRRRAEREKRRKEKEKRNQQKLKQATEMIIKKALEQDNEMLGSASDIDIEEMRLIEEAMQQVPEQEEEFPQTDPEQLMKKKKKKVAVEIKPLPPAGKGILVSPGFRKFQVSKTINLTKLSGHLLSGTHYDEKEKLPSSAASERKSVKFADGIRPGEGTSPSAGEDLPSPPPPPRKLPKEKRYKKKKKKKIKVKIIRQINVEDEDDDDEDISPPPPPPGSPPPPPMYPPGAHYPSSYPPGFTYSSTPPFTVLPGVDSSTGTATGTSGNIFTPLYHQHHHTTTTTHTTTVQFAPPPPPVTPVTPVTPVPPPAQSPHLFKRESKSNP